MFHDATFLRIRSCGGERKRPNIIAYGLDSEGRKIDWYFNMALANSELRERGGAS